MLCCCSAFINLKTKTGNSFELHFAQRVGDDEIIITHFFGVDEIQINEGKNLVCNSIITIEVLE